MLVGLSLGATRQWLVEASRLFLQTTPLSVSIESASGVDAARMARGGKAIDVMVLPSNVMAQLETEGWILPGSGRDVARSGIAIAVRSGLPRPAIATENDVKQAVLEADKICYSSGPSGDYLKGLFERWNIAALLADRRIEAKPGVPVGQILGRGEADLGFQQLSEFLDVGGIDIVGPLPPEIQIITVFTAGVSSQSADADGARAFVAHLTSPEVQAATQRFGMDAAE